MGSSFKKKKKIQESMNRCLGRHDVTTITLKTALNTIPPSIINNLGAFEYSVFHHYTAQNVVCKFQFGPVENYHLVKTSLKSYCIKHCRRLCEGFQPVFNNHSLENSWPYSVIFLYFEAFENTTNF